LTIISLRLIAASGFFIGSFQPVIVKYYRVMIIPTVQEVVPKRAAVRAAAEQASADLARLARERSGLALLESIRFTEIGRHPFEDHVLNLVEQVNQTFTILVSLAAVEWLFAHHPNAAPFTLNPGTKSGSDILGQQESLAAEVFAAVRPGNNRKLNRDIKKVAGARAARRFVFYYCPDHWCEPYDAPSGTNVRVVPLTRAAVLGE
jgi:hypothetical protein